MSVPLFELTKGIKQIAADAIDTLILQLGKPCRLIYPPVTEPCPQGCPLPAGAKQATDVWRTGTTVRPGNLSLCPLCGGTGLRATIPTETITLLCNFKIDKWGEDNGLRKETDLRYPSALCHTKGFITDLPKLLRCTEAVLATNVEPYAHYVYRLAGEPMDTSNIVQARYFEVYWKRAG